MIVAHLSDLHLGFRAYGRVDRGLDVRERDVTRAFDGAVRAIVELRPDLVVVAGDVFDRPDPPAGAVVTLARSLELLRSTLPDTPVLMVSGPRDTPRRSEDPGSLAVVDTFPNVEAATRLTRSLLMERLGLHAALVPYRATVRESSPPPEPEPRARWNVLVVHGCPGAGGAGGIFVDPDDWDYVALGGEHRRREVAPNVHYPGSLERVTLDPWDEAADEKGFLVADLAAGTTIFRPVPVRPVVALAPIRLRSGEPERMRRRVREVTGEVPGGLDGKIVRLRLDGVRPVDLLALQGEPLAELRARALHLAVEAGDLPALPPERGSPTAPTDRLRAALRAELVAGGVGDEEAESVAERLIPEPPPSSRPVVGDVDAIEGVAPGLGRLSAPLPRGLTAVIGGDGRSRRAVARILVEAGVPEGASPSLVDLWTGRGAETLEGALRQALDVWMQQRGLPRVDDALGRATAAGPEDGGAARRRRASDRPTVRIDPEEVAAELGRAERDLRDVRADTAEADGDLQAASMDWHRERQDAETTLNAYRDRARELKLRIRDLEAAGPAAPCPTCGRELAAHFDEVLSELREEWEGVVQDGRWWKSRWEQLEGKPEHLQELERASIRLHAALEAGSERVELLRARLGEVQDRPPAEQPGGDGTTRATLAALRRIREAWTARARARLLDRASRYLGRISGGRILAMTADGDGVELQGDEGPLSPRSEEDLAAARLAVRLAGACLLASGPAPLGSLLVEEPFDRLEEEAALRTLALLRGLATEIPRIVLLSRGDAVDANPEAFDAILELRDERVAVAPVLRPGPAGPGRLLFPAPRAGAAGVAGPPPVDG